MISFIEACFWNKQVTLHYITKVQIHNLNPFWVYLVWIWKDSPFNASTLIDKVKFSRLGSLVKWLFALSCLIPLHDKHRLHSLVVTTLDFESKSPSSNLGGAYPLNSKGMSNMTDKAMLDRPLCGNFWFLFCCEGPEWQESGTFVACFDGGNSIATPLVSFIWKDFYILKIINRVRLPGCIGVHVEWECWFPKKAQGFLFLVKCILNRYQKFQTSYWKSNASKSVWTSNRLIRAGFYFSYISTC